MARSSLLKRHYPEVSEPRYRYLKAFQSDRLRHDYADFSEDPQNRAAASFFFDRLYSTEDTTERDASFKRIHANLKRFLGGEVAESMAKLIELQEITLAMDHKLLEVLAEQDAPTEFDEAAYERAYRLSDNYDLRLRQIELLVFTNRLVHKISHRFGIGVVLMGLRNACLLLSDTRMVDFLMEGYRAFKNLKSVEPLVAAIQERETQRLNRIYRRSES